MKTTVYFRLILCLTTILICYQPSSFAESTQDDYSLHAESSERLITIMRRLFSIVHEGDVTEEKTFSQDDMTDLVEAVEELLFYAELMSSKIPSTELEENETVIFSAMAGKLYSEALNVQQLANNYDFSVINNAQNRLFSEALERLNRTCAACHQLFRDK